MAGRKYGIKNKNGEWFSGFAFSRGLTKNGKPKRIGPAKVYPEFVKGDPVVIEKSDLDYYVHRAVRDKIPEFFEDTEIVGFVYTPAPTTLKMKTVRERAEAKEIMFKLKRG